MSKNFQPLSSGEVLSVSNESQIVIGHSTFRVSEFTAALKQLMLDNGVGGVTPETIDWLTAEGIDCDVLRFGSDGWVKGKVRLHLEFSEDSDAEASPDPKTEAAIESFAPVAAATVIAESAASETDDVDLGFADDEFDISDEAKTEAPIDAKDTFVQEDDESFEDLFAADELEEDSEESGDDDLDDLFAEEALGETEEVESLANDTDTDAGDDDFDAAMGEFDDLLSDDESDDSAIAIAADENTELDAAVAAPADEEELDELFGDESLFDDDDESNDEISVEEQEGILAGLDTELEAIGEEITEDGDDALDLDFGDTEEGVEPEPSAELESLTDASGDDLFGDVDDDLFADTDDVAEESASETEETLDELDIDTDDSDDDLFADADDLFGEEESSTDDGGADASLDDLSFDDDSLLEDDDSGDDDGTFAEFDELLTEEESAEPATDDDEGELGLDSLFDEDASETEESLFDDPFEEAIAEEETEVDDDSLTDFEAAGDTEIDGDAEDPVESSFDLEEDNFSFDQSEPDFDESMDDDVASLLLDSDDDSGDEDDDLTEEELPPEIDFGSTEDLGEFIDVSIMKKKMASPSSAMETETPFDTDPQVGSPFDLGDDSAVTDNDGDDEISLGELFESNDDEDFDFDALDDGDDPLDAVTGEEEEVSADIWELE